MPIQIPLSHALHVRTGSPPPVIHTQPSTTSLMFCICRTHGATWEMLWDLELESGSMIVDVLTNRLLRQRLLLGILPPLARLRYQASSMADVTRAFHRNRHVFGTVTAGRRHRGEKPTRPTIGGVFANGWSFDADSFLDSALILLQKGYDDIEETETLTPPGN